LAYELTDALRELVKGLEEAQNTMVRATFPDQYEALFGPQDDRVV
jgi:hypothetical protein